MTNSRRKGIAAFDLGSNCGYAKLSEAGSLMSGTLHLKQQANESPGMRYIRFENALADLLKGVKLVFFENVVFHGKLSGAYAAHVYGALKAIIQVYCDKHDIDYTGFVPLEIKKLATGKGQVKKEVMLAAAQEKWPDQDVTDDNQADALWILELGKKRFPRFGD